MALNLTAVQADITTLAVDAIVNAANTILGMPGSVRHEYVTAAGLGLLQAYRLLGGIKTGQAKVTPGFSLPARYVIHTLGPVWRRGKSGVGEDVQLASCYAQSLAQAEQLGLTSIAFPSISTGINGFPRERAALIAVRTVTAHAPVSLQTVVFCSRAAIFAIYQGLLAPENP